jgi:D-beta-D-heptose 7-phosphate kinase/D-beta-D-heptose 1-phosphate adenosyltransferase
MAPHARTLFERANGRKILVVGDLMIDEWIWGTVTRISPEAPVPVVAVADHSFTLGGAGNVANNLRALRASVIFAGIVGSDAFADQIRTLLRNEDVDDAGVFAGADRPTTRKTRVVAHNQQVVRADWESTSELEAGDRGRLVEFVRERAPRCDAVILSDYAKGLFSRELVEAALTCPLVLADPKPQNIGLFSGVTCVAPNSAEASAIAGTPIVDDASLERAGVRLIELLDCRYAIITRGEHGMALFGRAGERLQIPSVARTVYDVSGAGDTVIAVLGLALAAGAPIEQAMQLANFAAGAVVAKLGTATASPEEILALLDSPT